MEGVFIPTWILDMNMQYAEKILLALVMSMPKFYGSNEYIASRIRISNENARILVYRMTKSGVLVKGTDDGRRTLAPSADVLKFEKDFNLLQGVTNPVTGRNKSVTGRNKNGATLYIEKERESISISKVDTKGVSHTSNSSSSKSKKEGKEKVTAVTGRNKLDRHQLGQFRKSLEAYGVKISLPDLANAIEAGSLNVVQKYGKFPGIQKMAHIITTIQDGSYEQSRHKSRS